MDQVSLMLMSIKGLAIAPEKGAYSDYNVRSIEIGMGSAVAGSYLFPLFPRRRPPKPRRLLLERIRPWA